MWPQAKGFINRGRWGPIVSVFLLSALSYVGIWAVIEPLEVPDLLTAHIPRWVPHLTLALMAGLILTIILMVSVRETTISSQPPFDHGYNTTNAIRFYNSVAQRYDNRNSPSLLRTHGKVVQLVRELTEAKRDLRVLDLGGGTGRGIAHQFHHNDGMSWHYVDGASGMVDIFRDNMHGARMKTEIEYCEISDFIRRNHNVEFDVIILSLVLTSLPENPDWAAIARMLAPGGKLIIADIDAAYTAIHPYYVVDIDGQRHGLAPRPIPLAELIDQINHTHLHFVHSHAIPEGNNNYSFIAEFTPKP